MKPLFSGSHMSEHWKIRDHSKSSLCCVRRRPVSRENESSNHDELVRMLVRRRSRRQRSVFGFITSSFNGHHNFQSHCIFCTVCRIAWLRPTISINAIMKSPSILIVVAFATAPATAGRRNTSAWNNPSRGRFGIRRTNNNNISQPGSASYIVEQALAASSSCADGRANVDMDLILQLQNDDSSPIEQSMHSSDSRCIVTEGVRAAAVACVSAAAIGGARHAIEMLLWGRLWMIDMIRRVENSCALVHVRVIRFKGGSLFRQTENIIYCWRHVPNLFLFILSIAFWIRQPRWSIYMISQRRCRTR